MNDAFSAPVALNASFIARRTIFTLESIAAVANMCMGRVIVGLPPAGALPSAICDRLNVIVARYGLRSIVR
jgi:hypothetical protein